MDFYMVAFEILIFTAAIVVIYLYWNSAVDISQSSEKPSKTKEGFTATELSNISMCPLQTKAYVAKNGDNLCCEGNPNGTDCEGKVACTLSSMNSKEYPSCYKYLSDYYARKSRDVCPRSYPNYYEDDKGRGFCTSSPLNAQLSAGPSAPRCSVGGKGLLDPESCEVRLALDKMQCPSAGCSKSAFAPRNDKAYPVILQANFTDSMRITRNCYDKNSVINFWRSIFGEEWKSRTSFINPDRNIMFCDVAKKYFIDKTLQKKDIDV